MDEWMFILVHLCFLLLENKIASLTPTTPTHSTVFRKKLPCFFLTERRAVITGFPHSVLVLKCWMSITFYSVGHSLFASDHHFA